MKDLEIPAFTTKILEACKQAAKDGNWQGPCPAGQYNGHYCPLYCYAVYNNQVASYNIEIINAFMRGYDLRDRHDYDNRFYILGQTFRKIAKTTGFL